MTKTFLTAAALALLATSAIQPASAANEYAKCYDPAQTPQNKSADCVMKVMAAINHKFGDAEAFVLGDTVVFTEPMMSCPNVDDAAAVDRQTPEWLAARGCKNL